MSYSMSLSVLQMVAACHPPCSGELHLRLAAPATTKRSVRRGLQLEVKEKSSIPLISYLFFFPPFFTILHCASPASTEKGNLEEIASAFCSKVQPFLLHSLGCSRHLNKSISWSCNSLHCCLVFDSKTHKNSWQLYRCVNAIMSVASILNPEVLLKRTDGS